MADKLGDKLREITQKSKKKKALAAAKTLGRKKENTKKRAQEEARLIIKDLPRKLEETAEDGGDSVFITDTNCAESEEYFYALRDALSGFCEKNKVRTDIKENRHSGTIRRCLSLYICWS